MAVVRNKAIVASPGAGDATNATVDVTPTPAPSNNATTNGTGAGDGGRPASSDSARKGEEQKSMS